MVLNYPEIASRIYPELLRAFQSHLLNDLDMIDLPQIPQLCRDPNDDKVIATAIYGRANFLLTENQDLQTDTLIELFQKIGVEVVTMNGLIKMLDNV